MERIHQIESLIGRIEESADPELHARVRELVEAILEFHGAGISRMLELTGDTNPLLREFARDESVSAMLLLYGLHPDDFESRVRRALDSMPEVELAGIEDGKVRVRVLQPGVARDAIESAVIAAAPEAEGIEIEGPASSQSFVPLEALLEASD